MRIRSLGLAAFGPFRGDRFEFGPGLNVVWGGNESGKSTLHGALLAALCGIPEAAQRRPEDRAFADRHRPWSGEGWRVGAVLEMPDGSRVLIDRDLDRPGGPAPGGGPQVAGGGGQDLGRELEWEGSADCVRWLGFNRRSFPLTASAAQGAVLRVVLEPDLLRDDLRRAAEGAGLDSGLQQALALLDVDLEDDLLAGVAELLQLDQELGRVLADRDRQVRLQLESEEATARSLQLSRDLRVLEGAIARLRAQEMQERVDRIRALRERFPERPPREERANPVEEQANQALRAWEARPEIPELVGTPAEELRARLEAIQDQQVEGDTEPDPAVLAAREVYEFANAELDRHWSVRPAEEEPLPTELTGEELRDLARQVEEAGPEPTGVVVPRLLRRRDDEQPKHPAARARAYGLEPDPETIRRLAATVEQMERAREEAKRWTNRHRRLRQESINAEARLKSALASRGMQAATGQVMQAVFRYVRECEERARIAARAAERENLEELLRARELQEERRRQNTAANEHALGGLKAAAKAAKVRGSDPEQLAVELRLWVEQLEQERAEREAARAGWAELGRLLEGRPDEELQAELDRRRRRSLSIAREVGEQAITAVAMEGDGGEQLARLRKDSEQAARAAAEALARYESEGWVQQPAAAEEARGEADRRVWELAEFREAAGIARYRLAVAAQSMNADIAPAVAGVLRRWLPRVSAGRYTEAWVDPMSLQVDVRGPEGDWQPAALLSQATSELVYLLLRLALVEHLTPEGRSCPLLLDDVTVQSDTERTEALLEILHEVSADQQVILFTREESVLAWAERHLDRDRDSLQRLGAVGASV